jgi:hypothetical protein
LQTSNLILDFEFDQHLESHKHVINIIMGFRDMGCYSLYHRHAIDTFNIYSLIIIHQLNQSFNFKEPMVVT